MFGRYFHSLTSHAPLLYHLICLRSLNTEIQEHMFGQCKAITRNTSNQHPNHVISNILIRILEEDKAHSSTLANLKAQESEVHNLALVLGPKQNTIIPKAWLTNSAVHYQAHLEHISDYLSASPGKWWKYTEDGIEFFDAHGPTTTRSPIHALLEHKMYRYRSSSLADIELYLHSQWEECCHKGITLLKVDLAPRIFKVRAALHQRSQIWTGDVIG